jgi:small subunit ribosomal protein S13
MKRANQIALAAASALAMTSPVSVNRAAARPPQALAKACVVTVAAASDLTFAMNEIVVNFQKSTGCLVRLSLGSSGNFLTQIENGAPFDVFFSADMSYPKKLEAEGLAAPGSTYIYGIGRARSMSILMRAGVNPDKKVKDLTEDEVTRIRQIIEEEGGVEGDLRKELAMNVRRLIEIGSYRGMRHRRSLPVRGQRTHTNARTRKGPRKGTIANKKRSMAKT